MIPVIKDETSERKISITVDFDLLEKARILAEEDDRSLSQFINLALREYLRNYPDVSRPE